MTHKIPNESFAVVFQSQFTEKTFAEKPITSVNEIISFSEKTKFVNFCYPPLLKEQFHSNAFADFSFANKEHLRLQLGYLILLCDGSKVYMILYVSEKNRSNGALSLALKVYLFSGAFDCSLSIKQKLK